MKKLDFWKKIVELWTGDAASQKRERDYLALQNNVFQAKVALKNLKAQKRRATASYERAQSRFEKIQRKIEKQPGSKFQAALDEAKEVFEKCKRNLDELKERDTKLNADLTIAEHLIESEMIKRRALQAIAEVMAATDLANSLSANHTQEAMKQGLNCMEKSVAKLEELNTAIFQELVKNFADEIIERMNATAPAQALNIIEDAINNLNESIDYTNAASAQLEHHQMRIQEHVKVWAARKREAEAYRNPGLVHQAHLRAVAWVDSSTDLLIECEKLANSGADLLQLKQHLEKIAHRLKQRIEMTEMDQIQTLSEGDSI